jgi:hypothetical protein
VQSAQQWRLMGLSNGRAGAGLLYDELEGRNLIFHVYF